MSYTLSTTLTQPYTEAVQTVRDALHTQGFGILSEIDLAATLRLKLGIETTPRIILGACRPQSTHLALAADPSLATLLPCNVVVHALDANTCLVETLDPNTLMSLATNDVIRVIASDTRQRLTDALEALANTERDSATPHNHTLSQRHTHPEEK